MIETKPKVIVICGPTASGKTGLSISLAKQIDGEIVSADSMQIYQDMDIGTAKVTKEEQEGIKHHVIDFVSPEKRFSVAEFKEEAKKAMEAILAKGKTPIVVGGTGLYVNSLIYNIKYTDITIDEAFRKKLEQETEEKGLKVLYERAEKIDPEAMKSISQNDRKRILRVLEIYEQTGKTKTQIEIESREEPPEYDYQVFAIGMDREILYERINQRVDSMIKKGLIEEVQAILKKYKTFPTAMQGLGYKEVVEYLNGTCAKEEMIQKIKQETRRYAKRQLTWFKAIQGIKWLDGQDKTQNNIAVILEVE